MNSLKVLIVTPLLIVSILLTGCGGSGTSANGTMSLSVADTPVDSASSVVVTFTGVKLQGGSGPAITFNFASPKQIDLLNTQNGNAASLLSGATIPAGNYQWISLLVDTSQSTIQLKGGAVYPLTIPSAGNTGLKLVSGFTMAAGGKADFTIDFDLRKAITQASGTYILKPALRLMDNLQVGTVSGSASNTFMIGTDSIALNTCSPAVYVYNGLNVTPADINTTSTVQPIETATLSLNNSSGFYDYTAAFLAPGDYTLAITCATSDDPTVADTLTFAGTQNVSVIANTTTTANF